VFGRRSRQAGSGREKPWRRHLRPTREGKVFIFVTLGVGLAAFNTGNNLIFLVFGFMLSLIVLSGILSELAIRGVRVERRPPDRAFVGSTCLVELELFNRKKRVPSYSLEVEDVAEGSPTERRCYFLKVGAGSKQVAGYRRTPQKRGILRFSGFKLSTRYPFGIFEKWRNLYAPGEMLVYPSLSSDGRVPSLERIQGADMPAGRVGPGTEIGGLRDYLFGDEARSIHWMRSASLGRLLVRERERDSSSQLSITLDNARPARPSADWDNQFEVAISRAAGLAMRGGARGVAVEVLCRGSRSALLPPGAPADPVLRFLALLQPVPAEDAVAFARPSQSAGRIEVQLAPEQRAEDEAADRIAAREAPAGAGPKSEAGDTGPGTRAQGGAA
jgi:uncharacterized protein (DUF58 family)